VKYYPYIEVSIWIFLVVGIMILVDLHFSQLTSMIVQLISVLALISRYRLPPPHPIFLLCQANGRGRRQQ